MLYRYIPPNPGAHNLMNMLSAEEISQARQNFTINESSDEHLFRCWQRQDCKVCLAEDQCSWCPMVGLPRHGYYMGLFLTCKHWTDILVCTKFVPDSIAGARIRREYMPALGGTLGNPYKATGLPGIDHHKPYIHYLYFLHTCRSVVGVPCCARNPLGETA